MWIKIMWILNTEFYIDGGQSGTIFKTSNEPSTGLAESKVCL